MRSKRLVYSISAASPRLANSSMIAATVASTSAALSRFAASSASKAVSNPASRVLRMIGIGLQSSSRRCCGVRPAPAGTLDRGAEPLDPAADLFRPRFQCRAVDDQPRGDVRDMLDLDQPIGG